MGLERKKSPGKALEIGPRALLRLVLWPKAYPFSYLFLYFASYYICLVPIQSLVKIGPGRAGPGLLLKGSRMICISDIRYDLDRSTFQLIINHIS